MDNNYGLGFKCSCCGAGFPLTGMLYSCPSCRSPLEILYDYKKIRKVLSRQVLRKRSEPSLFRYGEFFPVRTEAGIYKKLFVGMTPFFRAEALEKDLGSQNIFIKDDSRNPSGSLKDRASIMALIHAGESGASLIIAASTGNAGASLSCLAAPLGMKCLILAPRTIPQAKLAQIMIFGASVLLVKGNYDDAFDLSRRATEEWGVYNRNTGFNPYTREGKKSVSFEIIEQMDFSVPDYVFVPVGDGNILSGVWKGFLDFFRCGLIRKLPRLVAVQAEGSSAVASAFLEKRPVRRIKASTLADSISVDLPRDGEMALKALKESGGTAVLVSDREILEAQARLAASTGVFAEPSGAAALAGLIKTLKKKSISRKSSKVLLVTGSGLKDIDAVLKGLKKPAVAGLSLLEVEREIKKV